jgi:LPS-assembly protein
MTSAATIGCARPDRIERIGGNSYLSIAGWATQTLRVNDVQGQQAIALPIIDYRQRLARSLVRRTFELQLNTLAIGRTAGQDTQRAFAGARWDLRGLTPALARK